MRGGGYCINSIIIKVWHERNSKNLIKTGPVLVESLGSIVGKQKVCVVGGRERERDAPKRSVHIASVHKPGRTGPREVVSRVVSMWPFGEGHDNMISLVHKNIVILVTSMVYK